MLINVNTIHVPILFIFIAGADTFNNSVFNDSTFNIILIYTQFILRMATYHTTFKVTYLI